MSGAERKKSVLRLRPPEIRQGQGASTHQRPRPSSVKTASPSAPKKTFDPSMPTTVSLRTGRRRAEDLEREVGTRVLEDFGRSVLVLRFKPKRSK